MDVVVVDDILSAAESAATLIEAKCHLVAAATDDPEVALSLIAQNPVKVAVIDQKMPRMSGTELYSKLQQLNPRVRAVMLTAEADADEVGSALRLGYADYVPKSEVGTLADVVIAQYMRYFAEVSQEQAPRQDVLIARRRRYFLFGSPIEYRLIETKAIYGDEPPDGDAWSTVQTAEAGQTVELSITKEEKFSLKIDEASEQSVKSTLNAAALPFKGFSLKLEAAVKQTLTRAVSSELNVTKQERQTTKLPDEPSDSSVVYVRSRHYQRAPVVARLQLTVVRLCEACGQRIVLPVSASMPTKFFWTRQVDYYSNGTRREIPTGVVQA